MNIGILLPRHARYRPDHLAVVFEDQRLTYRQFNRRVNRLANAFMEMGIIKGDKIATILPNCLELLDIYWAVAKIGAVVVPLSPMLRGAGLTRLLSDSDSVLVVTNASFTEILDPLRSQLPAMAADRYVLIDGEHIDGYRYYPDILSTNEDEPPAVEINNDDPYNIIYSSGTTGLPKGIVHTHFIRANYCTGFAAAYRFTPESIVLHTGSLVFNGAFLTLMPCMFVGGTFILHRQFDVAKMIETVERESVTHIKMVPSQIVAMLHAPNFSPQALQSLEMLGSVGAPLHLEHKTELTRHLPDRFYELYGLTEGFMTVLDKNDYPAKPNSVGVPLPFFEMRILDADRNAVLPGVVGEIVGRGPMMMPGYYKRPDLTDKAIINGWLHSGDLGYMDEDGFLYLVDRQKDMIISGGVNVYPRDIEEIIVQHPAVREVAVFGAPDEKWGETPVASVILAEPGAVTADELQAWTNERVEARYQKLSDLIIMDDFPRSVAGKTLKRVMREPYWQSKGARI